MCFSSKSFMKMLAYDGATRAHRDAMDLKVISPIKLEILVRQYLGKHFNQGQIAWLYVTRLCLV